MAKNIIKFSGKYNKGQLDPTKHEMVSVCKSKYMDVHLCLKISKFGNLMFADLNLCDGTYADKERQFEAMSIFAEQMADAWNKQYQLGKYKPVKATQEDEKPG